MGEKWKQCQILFWGPTKSLWMVTTAMKLKDTYSLEGKPWQIWTVYEKAEISPSQQMSYIVKAVVFPVVMYECENWTIKKAEGRRIDAFVVLEKTLESPMDYREIKPVNPKENQPWIFTGGRIDDEAPLATWCEKLTHWKRRWCWARFRAKGEEGDRGWDGWMASPTQ